MAKQISHPHVTCECLVVVWYITYTSIVQATVHVYNVNAFEVLKHKYSYYA